MTIAIYKNQKQDMIQFNPDQVALIKSYLCKGITDDELSLFSQVCKKTGLCPFLKQIYPVKRKNYKTGIDDITFQTGIDGYRVIAERTGKYVPGRKSTYDYRDGKIVSATSYVKKLASDGSWHEVEVEAFMDEYKPPATKSGYENAFWKDKPHIMLAKCAEALALRKAFPNELSGIYTSEEMQNSPNPEIKAHEHEIKPIEIVSESQAAELQELHDKCSSDIQEKMNKRLQNKKINSFYQLPLECYELTKDWLSKKLKENDDLLMSEMSKVG